MEYQPHHSASGGYSLDSYHPEIYQSKKGHNYLRVGGSHLGNYDHGSGSYPKKSMKLYIS
jgi:hypothetical protein